MSKPTIREQIQNLYTRVRAGYIADTKTLHITESEFTDELESLISQSVIEAQRSTLRAYKNNITRFMRRKIVKGVPTLFIREVDYERTYINKQGQLTIKQSKHAKTLANKGGES